MSEQPGFHDDGSRIWRFPAGTDPHAWAPDGNLSQLDQDAQLHIVAGVLEANPEGNLWTFETAVAEYQQHAAGAQYGNVMDELKDTLAPHDGLWSASHAAQVYGDDQYAQESGLADAHAALEAPSAKLAAAEGYGTPADYDAFFTAQNNAAKATADSDLTRNRYQQTTDFAGGAEEYKAFADQSLEEARQTLATDPRSLGADLTPEQRKAYDDIEEYNQRTGQAISQLALPLESISRWQDQLERWYGRDGFEIDPTTGPTLEQRGKLEQVGEHVDTQARLATDQQAWLEQARATDIAAAEAAGASAQAAYEASGQAQQDQARQDRMQERFDTQDARVQASRERAENIMQTPVADRPQR